MVVEYSFEAPHYNTFKYSLHDLSIFGHIRFKFQSTIPWVFVKDLQNLLHFSAKVIIKY